MYFCIFTLEPLQYCQTMECGFRAMNCFFETNSRCGAKMIEQKWFSLSSELVTEQGVFENRN